MSTIFNLLPIIRSKEKIGNVELVGRMVLWFYVCDLAYDTMGESLLDHFCPQFSDSGASLLLSLVSDF